MKPSDKAINESIRTDTKFVVGTCIVLALFILYLKKCDQPELAFKPKTEKR